MTCQRLAFAPCVHTHTGVVYVWYVWRGVLCWALPRLVVLVCWFVGGQQRHNVTAAVQTCVDGCSCSRSSDTVHSWQA